MLLTEEMKKAITGVVYGFPELNGCIIGYHGDKQSEIISPGITPSVNFGRVCVILECCTLASDFEDSLAIVNNGGTKNTESNRPNSAVIGAELVGAGLSCSVAVVSGVGAITAVTTAPATGFVSLSVAVFAWTGFLSSSAQCAYGIARSVEAIKNPEAETLAAIDSDQDIRKAAEIADIIGLGSSAAMVGVNAFRFFAVLGRNSNRLSEAAMRGFTRAQRVQVFTEEVAVLNKTETGRAAIAEALKEAGASPKDLERIMARGSLNFGGSYKVAPAVASALKKPVAEALRGAVHDALIGITISALPQSVAGSASGVVNTLVVNVINR
jgi:hypothetical protein